MQDHRLPICLFYAFYYITLSHVQPHMHSPLIHDGIDVTWTDVMRPPPPLHLSVPWRIDRLWREEIRSAGARDSRRHIRREVVSHFLADISATAAPPLECATWTLNASRFISAGAFPKADEQ